MDCLDYCNSSGATKSIESRLVDHALQSEEGTLPQIISDVAAKNKRLNDDYERVKLELHNNEVFQLIRQLSYYYYYYQLFSPSVIKIRSAKNKKLNKKVGMASNSVFCWKKQSSRVLKPN